MNIKNKKIVDQVFRQLIKINERMPNPDLTETISVGKCLGRKIAEDIYANANYPSVALSAISGEMFNLKQDITKPEQIKKVEIKTFYGTLGMSGNPFKIFLNGEYTSSISRYMKIGNIANAVITTEQYSPWLSVRGDFPLNENEQLKPIRIGSGLISIGSDYKEEDLILRKDSLITLTKKMLLKQAKVTQLTVYRTVKIAVLCVDYGLEDLNSNFEFQYIQECMSEWGYDFEVIKIKPFCDNLAKDISIEDSNLTIDVATYVNELEKVTKEFDYVVACGLTNNITLGRLGLMGTNRFIHRDISGGSVIGNAFRMYCGEMRAPIKRKKLRFTDEKGRILGDIHQSFEDFCLITYLPGYILDIILNMQLVVKPNILNRLYARPFQPEWKIGVLTHDYIIDSIDEDRSKILWAYVSDVHYDGKFNAMRTSSIPEIKIIPVENERPDMLSFMKDCNCFIPILGEDNPLKAGDYLYYLEI